MTHDPVPLVRRFSRVPKTDSDADEQEARAIWGRNERTGWDELEQEYRCIILAEAGAGKSFEMEARAKLAKERGRAAFFIRIEDIEDGFEGAFEVGSADDFESWLNSKDEAWFYLDSIDEARLENPRVFEKAIKRFARRIKPAQQRARIFLSSRPYAWRAGSDRRLVEQHLPFQKPKAEKTDFDESVAGEDAKLSSEKRYESALQVYLLDPLSEADIRLYASHRDSRQVDRLLQELERANLMSLASRPFDLEGILSKWHADQSLDGRLELLLHNIELRLQEIDPDRGRRQPIDRDKARQGARTLAAAVVLTGEPGIRVPESMHPGNGIDAEAVLRGFDASEVQTLLERGLFNDVLYGIVRFRHREVRELLAAEWVYQHLKDGNSRRSTEALLFREQYGHLVITPRLRPILPWLILFDDTIRQKALAIAPEIAVEGGDAAQLPHIERQKLLEDIVSRIARDDDSNSARDNSAIARIAQPDLTGDALRLIAEHRDNDDAIFFLGRLAWQGEMADCVPALADIVADAGRGVYARIAAARAVMTCGHSAQKENLWAALNEMPQTLPRRLLAELLDDADPASTSVNFLIKSLDKVEAYQEYKATGLTLSLNGFIDRLSVNSEPDGTKPLAALVAGLNQYLDREPHLERRECRVSEAFSWLLGPATHAVKRLVQERSTAALSDEAISVLLKMPVARHWRAEHFDEYKNGLHEMVPTWHELNDRLFWQSVANARAELIAEKSQRLTEVWSVQWIGHYWGFDGSRFGDVIGFINARSHADDKLVAVSLAHRLYVEAGEPSAWLVQLHTAVAGKSELEERLQLLLNPTKPEDQIKREQKWAQHERKQKAKQSKRDKDRADWIEHLKSNPDMIRNPPGLKPGEFTKYQLWLLGEADGEGLGTRRRGANWQALIPEFGEDVAVAYRDAAVAHWRHYTPTLPSEGANTGSTPYTLIFGMAGLQIEANETTDFFVSLTEADARHALRYLSWELNGFPDWLEHMHQAHPQLVLEAVVTELHWQLANADPDQPMHGILHDLVYHAPWMHPSLLPVIMAWLKQNDVPNDDALRYCVHILKSGGADPADLSHLAQSKIATKSSTEQRSTWYALWIDCEAEQGIPAVELWLSELPPESATKEAQLLVTKLMGTRRDYANGLANGTFRSVKHLKALYVLMHQYIRTDEDIHRAGTGVYSPELRDDAQEGRNALFSVLSEIPGKETFTALTVLSQDHPDTSLRPWMKKLAYRRAEQDADLEAWSPQQVHDFDQHQTRTPKTHRQLFDLTVDRLFDLKAWIEGGNDSPYKTWQKTEDETEMRNLIAGWLKAQSSGRFTCAQENELANAQRPDIWTQNALAGSPVPIELKVLDKGWSGSELCERLINQLAGDYLREETAGCGVFLLVWQGRSTQRKWQINGQRVTLTDLPSALRNYWSAVSGEFPNVSAIQVVLIDLTVRDQKSA